MQKLRAGIIGLGVGERHAVGYEQHPASSLAVICDTDPAKLKEVAARHQQAKTTTNPDDLFKDSSLEIISIASYDSAHFGQVMKALQAGKHVFVEKPMCLSLPEANKIRAVLHENPELILSCRFPCRLIPRFVAVKKLVEAGTFGKLYAVEGTYNYGKREKLTEGWRANEPNYSIVLGGGVHIVDLLIWLVQQPITSVTAQGNRIALAGTNFKFNDYVKSTVRFANNVIGDVTCNFGGVAPHFHSLKIDGHKAAFINYRKYGELITSPKPKDSAQRIQADYPGDKGQLDHQFSFIDAIQGKGQLQVTADQIFADLAVCFAIEEAIRTGRPVKVQHI